jgi:hypothetical protein
MRVTARQTFGFAIAILAFGVAIWIAREMAAWAAERAAALETGAPVMIAALVVLVSVYGLLIAIPFVPGVEIGMALLMIGGAAIAPVIWVTTIAGLFAAFLVGRLVPEASLVAFLQALRLQRAAALLARLHPLDTAERLDLLAVAMPASMSSLAGKSRYLLLAVLVNLPGNAVLGGGGGILMMAGFSRLFAPLPTLLTLALAVAPVPLLVYGFGLKLPLPVF